MQKEPRNNIVLVNTRLTLNELVRNNNKLGLGLYRLQMVISGFSLKKQLMN